MASIRSKDTKPELLVRSALHRLGYRFRVHDTGMPGRPDIVFSRRKIAVQVFGCFWHQHAGCPNAAIPNTRRDYWAAKLHRNVLRDQESAVALANLGWRVHVIWECNLGSQNWLGELKKVLGPPAAGR
jgi:DNA mismatch endonuclease Vsr